VSFQVAPEEIRDWDAEHMAADRLLADHLPPSRLGDRNSPAKTLSTIRAFFSAGIAGLYPCVGLSFRTDLTALPQV
jgi:hypothetical protein